MYEHVGAVVRRFAEDVVGPKVREMDESEMMDKSIIKGLFEQGVSTSALYFQLRAHALPPAYGHRDQCGLRWSRVLVYVCYYCD